MGLTLAMTLIFEFSRSYVILTIWWPRSGVRIYQIVTGVTSVVGVPSTHLVLLYHDDIISVVTLLSPTSLSNGKFLGRAIPMMVTFTMFENLFQDWNTIMKISIKLLDTIYCLVRLIFVPEPRGQSRLCITGTFFQQNGLVDGLVQMNILMKTCI